MMPGLFAALTVLLLLTGAVGQAHAQTAPPAATPAPKPAAAAAATPSTGTTASPRPGEAASVPDLGDYRIGPEDVLQISVWRNEAISQTVPVRSDGRISLPLLNDVEAASLTPTELRDSLIKKLTEYMLNPEVSVIVVETRSFKVSIIGEVPRPGRYELKSWATVLEILAMAGGLNQFASRGRLYVMRPEGKGHTRIPFNYKKAVGSPTEQENFYLRAGDIVVVP